MNKADRNLIIQAVTKFAAGVIITALLLFVPAGTLNYINARLFMCILFIPMFIAGVILMIKNPALLRKRLGVKENEGEQRSVVIAGALMFICGFVTAGLDYRFQWLVLPQWLVITASVIFLSAYLLYAEVLRENAYLSRTVEIQQNQKVIDTGLYGIVRHPMYAVTILLFLSAPLVLGSLFAFVIFLIYPFITVKRIKNEERLLTNGLPGYSEYMQKVRYRIIPFIW
ncbi:MAG: isoprenylcysteine carboxylmethyltransferase family protein [Eubacteriales bacterium]|nr:isoprenylcysteine carboxylmethyltransferase family protein [Eubacteriales bacterium]